MVIDYFYPYAQPNADYAKTVKEFIESNISKHNIIIPSQVLNEIKALIFDAMSQVNDLMHRHIIDSNTVDWDVMELSERMQALQNLIDNYDVYLNELSENRKIKTTQFRRAFGKGFLNEYKNYLSSNTKKQLNENFNDESAIRVVKQFDAFIQYSQYLKINGLEEVSIDDICLGKIFSVLKNDYDSKILLEIIIKHINDVDEDYLIVTRDLHDFSTNKKKLENIECINKKAGLDKIKIKSLNEDV